MSDKPEKNNKLFGGPRVPFSRLRRTLLAGVTLLLCCLAMVLGTRSGTRTSEPASQAGAQIQSSSRLLIPDNDSSDVATESFGFDSALARKLEVPKAPQKPEVSLTLPGIVITLGPNGFEPRTVTRPVGPFALIFLDRTRLDAISLSLEADSGSAPFRSAVDKRKPERIDTYDLSPGHYVLREENHPQWFCEVVITPQ